MSPLPPAFAGSPTRRRQRGAMSTLAAIGLAVAVASALLAVDLGSVFYTRRHLQTVADTAALSAVNDIPQAQDIATKTAGANNFAIPGTQGNTLATVGGSYNYQTRTFTAGGIVANQNAVQVNVSTQQPYFFMLGSREITATATAARTDVAGLSVGTGLIDIDTHKSALLNGLLGGLLKTSVNLDVLSYKGLANTNVRLLDLVKAQGRVGTAQELLGLDLSLAEWLRLTAAALTLSDIATVDAKAIDALNLLAAQIPGGLHLKMGELLDASLAPGNAAAEAQLNVLQLLTLSAQLANGKNFLNIPAAGLDLGGLAKLNVAMSMIEPPQLAIGPAGQDSDGNWRTQAHTAQWRIKLDLTLLSLYDNGSGHGSLVHLPIYLEVAAGNARLKSIQCRLPRDSSIVTIRGETSVVRAYVGEVNADAMTNVTKPAKVDDATIVSLTGLLGVTGLLDVTTKVELDLPGAGADLEFSGPFDEKNTQRISGLSTQGLFAKLGSNLKLYVELLGIKIDVGDLLKPLLQLLAPVFGLLDSLLAPVLQLLGIDLGYGDVTNFYLKCGAPQLVR